MDLSFIGRFSKTHGLKGHLILTEEAGFDPQELKVLFVDSATGKAPFFISEIRESGQGLLVKLEDIDSVERAKTLVNRQVYTDSKLVEEEQEEELIGYELIDYQHGSLGKILAVSHNGSQDLVSLNYKGKEVILPLVDEFIEQINEDKQTIIYNAPEGLIDLYLSEDGESE